MTMSFWTDEPAEVRTHKKEFPEQMLFALVNLILADQPSVAA